MEKSLYVTISKSFNEEKGPEDIQKKDGKKPGKRTAQQHPCTACVAL